MLIQPKLQTAAHDEVLRILKEEQGYQWTNIVRTNNWHYTKVMGTPNIGIILKHRWFEHFETFARKWGWKDTSGEYERGIGDSLNVEQLQEFVQAGVVRLYIYYSNEMTGSAAIYSISLLDFLAYSHKWPEPNKEGKYVRSISIHRYTKMKVAEGQFIQ